MTYRAILTQQDGAALIITLNRPDKRNAIEFETFLVTMIYGTKDKQEGIPAFLEKRKPRFEGK
ncbi:MAG: hypothetical protein HY323_18990 [Betaproteobacteria bacterium]|nr:hypothetical protein [Betaproteobacteria bacterium]MBI3939065.1 hypothetical protein [Betaproteobacteria bacterium]